PAQAAVGQFSVPRITPSPVGAPGEVEARFDITGVSVDASTQLKVLPSLIRSPYTDRVDSVGTGQGLDRVRVEGAGKLVAASTAIASLVPLCNRGGVRNSSWTTYRLEVPANATTTVVVRLDVPKGLPGSRASFVLDYQPLTEPGAPQTILDPAEVVIPRTGSIDGLTLKASKRKAGKATLSGRVAPARRGEKVTFIAQPSTAQGVDSLFGEAGSAFPPLGSGVTTLGSTRTGKGGKFSASVKVPAGVAVVARTAGDRAGASCAVHVA
ncbi:MAG: hypothetical protein Q7V62_05155, partial [Actinomycetota bacterium]|nr:hypothetical protein [Actinomycetota bacterium]